MQCGAVECSAVRCTRLPIADDVPFASLPTTTRPRGLIRSAELGTHDYAVTALHGLRDNRQKFKPLRTAGELMETAAEPATGRETRTERETDSEGGGIARVSAAPAAGHHAASPADTLRQRIVSLQAHFGLPLLVPRKPPPPPPPLRTGAHRQRPTVLDTSRGAGAGRETATGNTRVAWLNRSHLHGSLGASKSSCETRQALPDFPASSSY